MPAFEMAAEGGGKLTPELEAAQAGGKRRVPFILFPSTHFQLSSPEADSKNAVNARCRSEG